MLKKSHDITGTSRLVRALFLVVLFAAYYCGSTLFVHSHNTWHGLITHSHPFSPKNHHSHTEYEFDTIAALNNIVADDVFTNLTVEPFECMLMVLETTVTASADICDTNVSGARAPPYFA